MVVWIEAAEKRRNLSVKPNAVFGEIKNENKLRLRRKANGMSGQHGFVK